MIVVRFDRDILIIILLFIWHKLPYTPAHRGNAQCDVTTEKLNRKQRLVLDVIWRHGPIPRVEIGPLTNLSTMAVTRVSKDLIARGLIVEEVLRAGARGQPTRPLKINARAAFAGGAYFSRRFMHICVVDLCGGILADRELALGSGDPRSVAQSASTAIAEILLGAGIDEDQFLGLGIALPGDFISDRQLNAHALFPEFAGRDIQAELQRFSPYEVFIENDAACAALGERMMGVGQTINHFFFTHIGHGIGGGLVIDGHLYRGARGNAGIIGIQFPNDRPRPSGQDLLESLNRQGVAVDDFDALGTLRAQNCPPLKQWMQRASRQLRNCLWVTARILDPEAIIVGGRLPAHLLQEIVARIDSDGFCDEGVMLPKPRVFASSLAGKAGVIGAAVVPLYRHFFDADS